MTEEDYFDEVLEKLVGNPVHVYSLIDRLVYHLSDITFIDEIFKFDIDELIENVEMPDESDVEGATQALVRIQFAYRYKIFIAFFINKFPENYKIVRRNNK